MNVALFIGRRLSFNPGVGRRKVPGIAIGVAGIALSLVVMMISISVVTGFKREIRDKVMGFDSQINIFVQEAYDTGNDLATIHLSDTLLVIVDRAAGPGATVAPMIRQPAILKTDSAFCGIVLKTLAPQTDHAFLREAVTEGTLPDYSTASDSADRTIVISSLTAHALGIGAGDKLDAHFVRNNSVASRRLTVAAVYDTHFGDYDRLYAFTSLPLLRRLNRIDSLECGALEINGLPPAEIDDATDRLRTSLMDYALSVAPGRIYGVENVHQTGAIYFNWLALLDTNVVVILALMTLVAGFTLISSLFILILDRVTTIGVLKALGATDGLIRGAFITMAERLVVRGLIIGNAVGLALLFLQKWFHVIPLDPEAYYLSYVPVEIDWGWLLLLNLGVAVVSCVMLILPSHMISTLSPARSMRYE